MSVLKLMMIIPMYARFSMLRRWLMKLTGQAIDCYLLPFLILCVTLAYLAYMSMSCLTQERGINEATAAWLRSVGIKRKECSVTVCSGIGTPQQFCVPSRGSYTFDLIIYNNLLAGDETISIAANEIPSNYAVFLGRKTIKQKIVSLKCFRFFSNLETGESLRGFVSYNLYATSSKSHLCSVSFSAPTAVAKPQAIVDFRGGEETEPASGWPKERFLTPEPVEDFVEPADEYEMPWEEDKPLQVEGG